VTYSEWAPPPDLAPFVQCCWSAEYDVDGPGHTVLPDGCIDVLFTRGETCGAIVAGAMTVPLHVRATGMNVLAVRFRPGCARPFLRDDAVRFTDEVVALADVRRDGAAFAERLQNMPHAERRDEIAAYLRTAYAGAVVPGAVRRAIGRFASSTIVDADVCDALGVTRQTLARSFRAHVGLTPKTYARVMRMQRAVTALRGAAFALADVALACGYSDEAHLANEFRRLTGTTPNGFRAVRSATRTGCGPSLRRSWSAGRARA